MKISAKPVNEADNNSGILLSHFPLSNHFIRCLHSFIIVLGIYMPVICLVKSSHFPVILFFLCCLQHLLPWPTTVHSSIYYLLLYFSIFKFEFYVLLKQQWTFFISAFLILMWNYLLNIIICFLLLLYQATNSFCPLCLFFDAWCDHWHGILTPNGIVKAFSSQLQVYSIS